MRSIGFGLVCDLRSSNERTAAPNSWCDERTRLLDVEITADLRADGNSAWDVLRANPTVEGALEAMRINYAAMPEPFAPYIRPLFEAVADGQRSEEHTSELQSLMRNSYAVFCLKKTT